MGTFNAEVYRTFHPLYFCAFVTVLMKKYLFTSQEHGHVVFNLMFSGPLIMWFSLVVFRFFFKCIPKNTGKGKILWVLEGFSKHPISIENSWEFTIILCLRQVDVMFCGQLFLFCIDFIRFYSEMWVSWTFWK